VDPIVEKLAEKRVLISRVAWRFVGRRGYRMDIDEAHQVATIAAWKVLRDDRPTYDLDGLIAVACARALEDEIRCGRVTGVKRRRWLAGDQPTLSLNKSVMHDDEDSEMLDLIEDDAAELVYGAVLDETVVGRAMAALPERHRFAVYLHFFEDLTQTEVGKILGVSESRVCQIIASARKKMGPLIDAAAA
jgi:RNA polymerase sigma factor (sigma-70 family)